MKRNWMIYLVLFVFIGAISGCAKNTPSVSKASVEKKPIIKITSVTISPVESSEEEVNDFLSDDFYDEEMEDEFYDPLETWNRWIFTGNDVFYNYLLFPVADGYHNVMPDVAEKGISNFFDNLLKPLSFVANILQGDFEDAALDLGAFMINSTWGIVGVFDIVDEDNKKDSEDISQTLAGWGVPDGPYVVWPFFGPSNIRNTFGAIGDVFLTPQTYLGFPDSLYIGLGDTVQNTANSNPYRDLTDGAIDPYMAVRNAYYNNFEAKVKK